MKLIDFDGIFDKKISEYIESNTTKYSEKQWSDIIPKLYEKFGDTVLSSVGTTPNLYYAAMDDDTLVETLKEHLKNEVPVSDFLCREMERRNSDVFLDLLNSDDETLVTYGITINGTDERAFPLYLDIICGDKWNEDVKDAAADMVKSNADVVRDRLLSMIERNVEKDYALDLIARIKTKDERVFQLLLKEFLGNLDDIPMYASFLASYGDDRALPYLLEQIRREDINYVEFQELKYAVEALGGEYNEPRDFSDDPYFRQIHGMPDSEASDALGASPIGGKEQKEDSDGLLS